MLRRGELAVEARLDPLTVEVSRKGRLLLRDLRFRARAGGGRDHLIHLTEGVIPEEEQGELERVAEARVVHADAVAAEINGRLDSGRPFALRLGLPERDRVTIELTAGEEPYRLAVSWRPHPGERLTGLGARHGERLDQRGRVIQLGADRRYTGPDCPPEMIGEGGVPQGDYAPAPWLLSNLAPGLWIETDGPGLELDLGDPVRVSQRARAGPLRMHLLCDPTPLARLRHYLRLTGLPALLPEWAYGHWKSRDVYEHERDLLEDLEGYEANDLALDAIVIDSPWETQYNTWRFNPNQFPDPAGLVARLRRSGVRTVVWVTPWVNLESVDGQYPPDPDSRRRHSRPAANYREGALGGHFLRGADGRPWVGRWWMGTGSLVDFTSSAARRWWRAQARAALELGIEGIKADDGEGYYVPPDARFADGRVGAEAAWAYGALYRRTMQRALDDAHPGRGVLFGRSGWTAQQAVGLTWGGDQVSDFWSLRTLLTATLTAAASGFSNWSHDVGGYLGRRLVERCPRELLLRWVQFGCFTPLMQSHGRFDQEAWRYDDETLAIYCEHVLLHERLVPYIRAAAATAARTGLPIIRPLCLTDPGDPRGWELADSYGFGPALWIAPVVEDGARERRAYLPRGEWIDFWSGATAPGGHELIAPAPLERAPVWVRSGSIVVTYPGEEVRSGLGDADEGSRPLEATLWGAPRFGRAKARLADGTVISWRDGTWAVSAAREVRFAQR
jgi:alpha-glucosidase (family GH31 glycosyl hydrolase)